MCETCCLQDTSSNQRNAVPPAPKNHMMAYGGVPHFGGRGYPRPKLYMQNPNKLLTLLLRGGVGRFFLEGNVFSYLFKMV